MKLIILAAGKGSRLMPLTKNTPKPLMDLGNGVTLLEKQLESITKSGVIDEVILVIGYLGHQIESKMSYYQKQGVKITTVYNPFFEHSNNLISLWLAKHEMNDEFMITNGDNIFTPDVFKDLVEKTGEGIHLTILKRDKYGIDDMKVTISDMNHIVHVSKDIDDENAHGESVGLVKVSGSRYLNAYKNTLEILARNDEYINKFWLETFNALSGNGVNVTPFEIVGNDKWQEIDIHVDLENFKDLISMGSQAQFLSKDKKKD
ncbi:MAG: phosphocholine cytidylyltransferase family protein [Candidatus Aenigmarchaeota archaeon]|nr:phosphocholine cytidylyltransferase family protein [Candidatus Aenigmarchaeota archaeon]